MTKLTQVARRSAAVSLAALFLHGLPSAIFASDQLDGLHAIVTPYVGLAKWGDGVNFNDHPVYGGRVGVMFDRYVGIEGTFGRVRNDTRFGPSFFERPVEQGLAVGGAVRHLGIDAIATLGQAVVSPYILGGYQLMLWDPDQSVPQDEDSFSGFEIGAGVVGHVTPRVGVRGEIRDAILQFDSPPAGSDDTQHNLFITVGIQLSLGGFEQTPDSDGDGVQDVTDDCPATPSGVYVDAKGCPIDGDKDGVPDGLDMCDATPEGATVDAKGCPSDSDSDGVFDGVDQCPETGSGIQVDKTGCPKADKETVPDGSGDKKPPR